MDPGCEGGGGGCLPLVSHFSPPHHLLNKSELFFFLPRSPDATSLIGSLISSGDEYKEVKGCFSKLFQLNDLKSKHKS